MENGLTDTVWVSFRSTSVNDRAAVMVSGALEPARPTPFAGQVAESSVGGEHRRVIGPGDREGDLLGRG